MGSASETKRTPLFHLPIVEIKGVPLVKLSETPSLYLPIVEIKGGELNFLAPSNVFSIDNI